jgi:hypothetical protein
VPDKKAYILGHMLSKSQHEDKLDCIFNGVINMGHNMVGVEHYVHELILRGGGADFRLFRQMVSLTRGRQLRFASF